jgi:N-acyl homoserine lactone hydrolase
VNLPGDVRIVPLELGEFTFADDEEPLAGKTGVVVAYLVIHPGGTLLFDTGFGFGNAELDAAYHPRARLLAAALADAGRRIADIDALANCHLHVDHAGQNAQLPGIPIYVQEREWRVAHADPDHTILDWIESPDTTYVPLDGDHEIAPRVRIVSTPGHTPGHQSLAVDTSEGLVVLAGQAVYSAAEWVGVDTDREGRSSAPDVAAYDRSIERLRALEPRHVYFAHERGRWSA